ncbi:GNAT family N-acetyltransferase [Niallia sp. 03133]|uniref:GNAT family N-acetyltransferase n=1 Tax=Niallia sp. 03133 TaxID=3458060 RepID=UPI00404503D5
MKPILMDFPEKIITERLYIRPCLPGDGKDVYKSMQRSKEDLQKWMPFANQTQTLESTEENIRKAYANFILKEDIRLHIYLQENNRFIGSTGLHHINWEVRSFEIGYWCDTNFTGNGYIQESTKALIAFAKESLHANRIEIRCDRLNRKSRAIPEKLGFSLDAILQNDSLSADGKTLRDTCIYSLTNSK